MNRIFSQPSRLFVAFPLALGLLLAMGLFALTGRASPANPSPDPPRNSHTAPLTTTVSIAYDEPISPTTVSSRTFVAHAMQSGQVDGTYAVRDGTVPDCRTAKWPQHFL